MPSDERRILVIRPDRIGDVVLSTPLIRALRNAYPGAYLGALVRPGTKPVLEGNPHLDVILHDDASGEHRGARGFWSLVSRIRIERFQTSLMLLPTRRHAVLTLLAGIPQRIGVGRKLYEVLTGTRPAGRSRDHPVRHEADYCMDLGRVIGVEQWTPISEVFLDHVERKAGRRRLEEAGFGAGPIVGLHPGNGGSAPNWTPDLYADLAERLIRETGAWIVITGEEVDRDAGAMIARGGEPRILDLTGRMTLRELMAILAAFDVLVSSSTGPMHLAASLGIPCVSLFCPRTACCPTRWGPLGTVHRILLSRGKRCDQCGPRRDPDCGLADVGVDWAFLAVREVLG